MFKMLPLFVLSSLPLLAGCGLLGLCTNECDPGWIHAGVDCGCAEQVKAKKEEAGDSDGDKAIYSSCTCAYSDGRYGAWFNSRPNGYGSTSVLVNAGACEYLPVCQYFGDGYHIIKGTFRLTNIQWGQNTNLLNGSTVYYAFGDPEKAASLKGGYTPIPAALGLRALHYAKMLSAITPTATDASCEAQCAIGSPNCLRLGPVQDYAPSLRQLYERLKERPATLPQSDLMAMFNVAEDPCNRGATTIAGAELTNRGDECNLKASLPRVADVFINIPELLTAIVSGSGPMLKVDFPAGARASLHFYAPKGSSAKKIADTKDLDNDWGGAITSISSDGKYGVFSINKSCVRTQLQ